MSHGAQGLTRGGETRLITIIDSHGKRNQWNSFLDVLKACRSTDHRNKRANSQDKQYHEVEIFDPSRFYRGALIPVEIGGNYCEIPWQDVLLSVRGNLDLITEKGEDGAAKIDRSASSKLVAENIQFLLCRNSFSMELGHSEWQKSYKIEN